jgi:hypothetical protein
VATPSAKKKNLPIVKRGLIQSSNPFISVPRKINIPKNGTETPADPGVTVQKKRSRTKTSITGKRKTARASAAKEPTPPTPQPSDEQIRIRAYFIAERRHRLALPGDADSDWLEAKRQLLSEL